MIRLLCFRQDKNLSKNRREALRFLRWGTHHIADVGHSKFCLLLRSSFHGQGAIETIIGMRFGLTG